VTDDRNAAAHVTQTVQVTSAGTAPTAVLTASPVSPRAGGPVYFNASGSLAGSSAIASYRFSYGDGLPDDVGPSVTQSHSFAAAGTYVVRLTVTDVQGRSGTATLNVIVVP
jgi:PKD repeat protein